MRTTLMLTLGVALLAAAPAAAQPAALEARYVAVMARFVAPMPAGRPNPCEVTDGCARVMRAAYDAMVGGTQRAAAAAVAAADAWATAHRLPRPADPQAVVLRWALEYELRTRPPGFPAPPGALDYGR